METAIKLSLAAVSVVFVVALVLDAWVRWRIFNIFTSPDFLTPRPEGDEQERKDQ